MAVINAQIKCHTATWPSADRQSNFPPISLVLFIASLREVDNVFSAVLSMGCAMEGTFHE